MLKFKSSQQWLKQAMADIIVDFTDATTRGNFIATGKTVASFKSDVKENTASVSVLRHWLTLVTDREDGGRGRGRTENSGDGSLRDRILEWIKVKGITPREPDMTLKQLAFVMTRSIHAKGTKLHWDTSSTGIQIQPIFKHNGQVLGRTIADGALIEVADEIEKKLRTIFTSKK